MTHLLPKDKMFGQPFIIKASAVVAVLNATFTFLEDVASPLAVFKRIGVSVSSTSFFSFFAMEPSPAMSTHHPLSMTHRRAPVAFSQSSDELDTCVTKGASRIASGTTFGAI